MQPDDLYGLPFDRFVAERRALAKALRADGRRQDATDVAELRKPSVAAWAVNQLVRTQGKAMKELLDAGDALRDAQAALLAGRGDGGALRACNERERDAVEQLVDAARGLLTSEGQELSTAIVERVADTLHAAALDDEAREQVREGRLERELRHAGLGLGDVPAGKARPKRAPAKQQPKPTAKSKQPAKRKEPAKAENAAARKAARVAEAKARRRADRAASALRAAEERRERAADALSAADQALAAARDELDAATAAHDRAQSDVKNA
jgi:hypothetical protein